MIFIKIYFIIIIENKEKKEVVINRGVAYKGWLFDTDLSEDPNKELDEFVKTLKLGIE